MRHALALIAMLLAAPAVAQDIPPNWTWEWPDTDFTKISVEPSEIMSGGPPKDGIPAIDDPSFLPVSEGELPDREAVVALELDGEARAYPIRYLMWHEIVNDRIGDRPVTVTYCPLCNAAIVFDGTLDGEPVDFGVSGKLRNSDMIMYDRQTESWWQQFTGDAIAGARLGASLTKLPSRLESWGSFRARNPKGKIMASPKGHHRRYGNNPYVGYDTAKEPFLYSGEDPPHGIPMMARVVVAGDRAWPMTRIVEAGTLTEDGVTLRWTKGQASALDSRALSEGREVGDLVVTDADGKPLVHDITFAFVFTAFEPDGQWMLGG